MAAPLTTAPNFPAGQYVAPVVEEPVVPSHVKVPAGQGRHFVTRADADGAIREYVPAAHCVLHIESPAAIDP